MACRHRWGSSLQDRYEECQDCGTFRSMDAPPADVVYGDGYWSDPARSSLRDQVYNVAVHCEGGRTKNEFVLRAIDVDDRSAALEIGCAPGVLLGQLQSKAGFKFVSGIEVDPRNEDDIRLLGGLDADLSFGIFPAIGAEYKPAAFNLIVAMDVFEHSHEPEAFLAECARLLKPNGELILMCPIVRPGEWMPDRMFSPIEHVYLHSASNVASMLRDAGFDGLRFGRWTAGHETVTARRV